MQIKLIRQITLVFCTVCLIVSCFSMSHGFAADNDTVVAYEFSKDKPSVLYDDWFCDRWDTLAQENSTLEAQAMLFSRHTYRNYKLTYIITCTQGSHTSFAKTYLVLRQPTGYMMSGDLLALDRTDLGNDNRDARPGRLGILLGMARTDLEITVHTRKDDGTVSNIHTLIPLPTGCDFRTGMTVEVQDAEDSMEIRANGTLLAKITMEDTAPYEAYGYRGSVYRTVTVTDGSGAELMKTEEGFVPSQGMFGFAGKGGRYALSSLSVKSLTGSAADARVTDPLFEHNSIHLERAPQTEAPEETSPPEIVTGTQSSDQNTTDTLTETHTEALTTAQVTGPSELSGAKPISAGVVVVLLVILNVLLITRGIWCFVLLKGSVKRTVCLIVLAVALVASDVAIPLSLANLSCKTSEAPTEETMAPEGTSPETEAATTPLTQPETQPAVQPDPEPEETTEDETYLLDCNGNTPAAPVNNANQTAQDALGRVLPTYGEVGDTKSGKYVGMFYTLWTMACNSVQDNSINLARNPQAPAYGSKYSYHWWAEPEVGYASATDAWVARRNLQYLSMAGVDYIYLDFTNAGVYEPAFEVLLDVCLQMRAEGTRVPGIVPWVYGDDSGTYRDIGYLYRTYYSQEKYKELWFYMDGRPLVMLKRVEDSVAQYVNHNKYLPALNNQEIVDFFTIRFAWVPNESDSGHFPGERIYRWSWGNPLFMHNYKENTYAFGWDEKPRQAEQITIIVGSYCNVGYGRSGEEGGLDQFNEKDTSGMGLYLQYQFDWVMEHHPEVEYLNISGWNEWIAQYYPDIGTSFGFVDSYNREFSRDIEPMKGGYTDNYFYQLCSIIRKFKGMDAPAKQTNQVTVDLNDLSVWDSLTEGAYTDFTGDTTWRDGTDPTGNIHYVNQTGRNDIIESKVAYDAGQIYFYARTAKALTPHTDSNWMLLFIDGDADANTGWEGYDFAVNLEVIDESHTVLCAYRDGVWQEIGLVAYKYDGNALHIAIPRSLLGETEASISLSFHWIDNVSDVYDLSCWFTEGDSAPERRNRYVFEATCTYDAQAETILAPRTQGQIKYMPAKDVNVQLQQGLTVRKYWLTDNYGKQPEINLLDGAGGNLVYSGITNQVTLIKEAARTAYALPFEGYIQISEDGKATFSLTADDGAVLYIDGRKVIDISGVHTQTTGEGSILLEAGLHEIRVEYFENGNGNSSLSLSCDKEDGFYTYHQQ